MFTIQVGRLSIKCDTEEELAIAVKAANRFEQAFDVTEKPAKPAEPPKVASKGLASWLMPPESKAPVIPRAPVGSYEFLNKMGLNKSKTVSGFTTGQVSAAIHRNHSTTGKKFSYESLDGDSIQVKRIE